MSQSGARSDVGRVRRTNQDAGYAGLYLFAVADGMGGHAGGDVASHITINHLAELDREFETIEAARDAVRTRMLEANAMLIKVVDDYPQLAGLGTTLSVILRVGNQAVVAHIGDSRVYRLRGSDLVQLTHDHTFVQRLIDTGQITPDEAAVHPRRSVLMRVLGDVDASPTIDVDIIALETNDVFMLCSDGLTGVVPDEDIQSVLSKQGAPQTLANELVTRSLAEGAPDNVTVVVARDLETTTAKATKLIGSASGENPLRTLPAQGATTEVPRAASLSLPVHTGGLPIAQLDTEHAAEQARVATGRKRVFIGLLIAILVAAIVVGLVIYTASTQDTALALASVVDHVSKLVTGVG
ncbi:MAG: hypothetical protein RLZZ600_179 [Actinomycetota bacterium]